MIRLITGAFAIAILATSCSSDGSGGSSLGTDPGAAGGEEVVRAGSTALFAGDWTTVHDVLTDECQEEMGVGDIAAEMAFGLAFLAGFADLEPEDLEGATAGEVLIENLVEGVSASARADTVIDGRLLFAMDDEGEDYVYQGGRWRSEGCEFGFEE